MKRSCSRIFLSAILVLGGMSQAAPRMVSGMERPRFTLADLARGQREGWSCATDSGRTETRLEAQSDPGLAAGDWLYFDPEPAVIGLDYKGKVRLRNFTVLGDFEEIELQLVDSGPVRSYERQSSTFVDGDRVSVFNLEIPYRDYRDDPVEIRFDEGVFPRFASSTRPKSKVVRINDEVQYASHVVNIVYPWDSAAMMSYPARAIADIFYAHFSDTYEELAFVPVRQYQSPQWGARHISIHNPVEGIGFPVLDERYEWNGSEVLQGGIVYFRGDLLSNYLSLHEMAHQWGFFFDLFEVAGMENTGTEACGRGEHVPLVADQPSYLSSCLFPPLRIEKRAGKWILSEAPLPPYFHPLQMYAMGLLEPDDVPALFLGKNQTQPASTRPGRLMKGKFVKVTIDDIIARYGERTGPSAPRVWRRAIIMVSPERLLSRKAMSWYNFFARRLSDPEVTGVVDVGGIPSLEFASRGKMDLRTEIRPRSQRRLAGSFEVSYPKLGKRDIRGLVLDRKLGSRYLAGKPTIFSGRVPFPGRHESVTVWLAGERFSSEIGAGNRFRIEILLSDEDKGPQWMSVWLGESERLLAQIAPVYVEKE